MNRGKILEGWRRKRAAGQPVLGGRSGPDFLVVSNEDRRPGSTAPQIEALLPLGDANAASLRSAREQAAKAGTTPIIAGVCGTDPLRLMDKFLQEMKGAGAAGVQNRPSVGMIDGGFRNNLEEAKLGYAKEVELIRLAARLDLITSALVFSAEDARAMVDAGADLVVIHWGLGPAPAGKERLKAIEEISAAARGGRKDVLLLAFGSGEAVPPLDGIQTD